MRRARRRPFTRCNGLAGRRSGGYNPTEREVGQPRTPVLGGKASVPPPGDRAGTALARQEETAVGWFDWLFGKKERPFTAAGPGRQESALAEKGSPVQTGHAVAQGPPPSAPAGHERPVTA